MEPELLSFDLASAALLNMEDRVAYLTAIQAQVADIRRMAAEAVSRWRPVTKIWRTVRRNDLLFPLAWHNPIWLVLWVSIGPDRPHLLGMVNTQKSYIRLGGQSKEQLRQMLADAKRNTRPDEYPIAVKVPDKKRALPTRSSIKPTAAKASKDQT